MDAFVDGRAGAHEVAHNRAAADLSDASTQSVSSASQALLASTAEPILLDGRTCGQCGYALDGLTTADQCPECGTPGRLAMFGALLVTSDPEYLTTLCRGAAMILWSLWARALLLVVKIVLAMTQGVMTGTGAGANRPTLWAVLNASNILLDVCVTLLALGGWWLLTTANPANDTASPQVRQDGLRLSIRAMSLVMLAVVLLETLSVINATFMAVTPIASMAILGLMILGYAVIGALQMAWIRTLARRLPDRNLASFAGTMILFHPLLVTIGCVFLGLGPLAAWIISIVIGTQFLDRLKQVQAKQVHTLGG